jgi:hypothetical protein
MADFKPTPLGVGVAPASDVDGEMGFRLRIMVRSYFKDNGKELL